MKVLASVILAFLVLLVASTNASAATPLTIGAGSSSVEYGASVTLSGLAEPAGVVESLVVESEKSTGGWQQLAALTSDISTGAWTVTTAPGESAQYRVRTADSSVISSTVSVAVAPKLELRVTGKPRPFVGAQVTVLVTPSTYSGQVSLASSGPSGAATRLMSVSDGRGTGVAPTDGAGQYRITGSALTNSRFGEATASTSTVVRGRIFHRGAQGPDVAALMARLRELGFLIPGHRGHYTFAASEVAMAFHKAYRMKRTYTWGQRDWVKISTLSSGPKARFDKTGTHIEVNKARQILMLVTDGKPVGIIAVSTGRTGNTPLGRFSIISRGGHPGLYRFMGFVGNYGIHGYYSVPPYPASHGCVREPNWTANWTWTHTRMGTEVWIYR